VRAVLFDLDDTLIDRSTAFRAYAEELVSRFPNVLGVADVELLVELDERGYGSRAEYCRRVGQTFPALPFTAAELWDDLAARLPTFIPRAKVALELLAQLPCPVALVSNGGAAVQRAKLAQAGLDAVLPDGAIFLSSELGVEKPAPAIFEAALRWIGTTPAEAIFVGDNPVTDIAGARGVGMTTLWLAHGRRWPGTLPRPSYAAVDLEDAQRFLL
jgi:putative hydrolase of the HAD superfamily